MKKNLKKNERIYSWGEGRMCMRRIIINREVGENDDNVCRQRVGFAAPFSTYKMDKYWFTWWWLETRRQSGWIHAVRGAIANSNIWITVIISKSHWGKIGRWVGGRRFFFSFLIPQNDQLNVYDYFMAFFLCCGDWGKLMRAVLLCGAEFIKF